MKGRLVAVETTGIADTEAAQARMSLQLYRDRLVRWEDRRSPLQFKVSKFQRCVSTIAKLQASLPRNNIRREKNGQPRPGYGKTGGTYACGQFPRLRSMSLHDYLSILICRGKDCILHYVGWIRVDDAMDARPRKRGSTPNAGDGGRQAGRGVVPVPHKTLFFSSLHIA